MIRGFRNLVLILVVCSFVGSIPTHAQDFDRVQTLHCGDFQRIVEFVKAEHLRFRSSSDENAEKLLREAIEGVAFEFQKLGYHYLAAQFTQQMKDELIEAPWTSARDLCERIPQSRYREFLLKSFISSLDPYSDFYLAEELPKRTSVVDGRFVGVGIATITKEPNLEIIEVVEDGPSDGSLLVGDLISRVDGHLVRGLTTEQLRQRIRGPLDTQVTFDIERDGRPEKVTITRGHVFQKSVTHEWADPGILQIKIHRFYAHTAMQVQSLIEAHSDAKGLILDLRDNPGGLLQGARDVVDLFVTHGVVVHLRGIYRDQLSAVNDDGFTDMPMVVLINERSASASEIVAGALQDYGRAMLVGRKPFGKSCVQNIYETHTALGTEYRGGLKLTTLWYYLPSGRSATTIEPDVIVASKGEETERVKMPFDWPQHIRVTRSLPSDASFRNKMRKTANALQNVSELEEAGKTLLRTFMAQSAQIDR